MKIALVHLSDVHFRTKTDVAFKRLEKLANAINYAKSPGETLIFAITGDISNTGTKEEYAVAEDFFRPLLIGLNADPTANGRLLLIPGNHDCDFHDLGDLRPRLLSEIESQLEALDSSGETVAALLQVQNNFFAFQDSLTGENLTTSEKLYRCTRLELGAKTLEFRQFNSAWLSKRHEDPGSLGFPAQTIETAGITTDSDVVISLIHHPANWLNPSVYQAFRKAVQTTSDFLLTGHEHTMGAQIVAPLESSSLIHIESGPLQDLNSGKSEFSIVHLDLEGRTWRHEKFWWSNGAYSKLNDGLPRDLFDKSDRHSSIQLTTQYLNKLSEPGTGFLHPRLQNLKLADIYIYPDLKTRSISRKLRSSGELPPEIASRDVADRLLKATKVVVNGPSDCGKTALLKMLYVAAAVNSGRSALMLCGKSFTGKNPETSFATAVDSAIDEQYGIAARDRYKGLDISKRILMIDDWDEISFNRAGRAAILKEASTRFSTVILAVDDVFIIDELATRHENKPLAGFEVVDVREFGYRLRGEMARKWHALGNTFIEDEQVFARHLAESIHAIDTILGRNLLPSYPVNILTLLQTYDAGAGSQNSELGSYGQVYEALITARLAKVSFKSIDIDTKITLLSRLAWKMFDSSKRTLNEKDWVSVCNQYVSDYGIRLDAGELKQACISASILSEDDFGIRFTYGYGYCYFVAKYFQENLADSEGGVERENLFARMTSLSELVYNQNNANIVIFYIFLTKDRSLINHVISNARLIFNEFSEFDFGSHVEFINKVLEPLKTIELPMTSPEKNQQAYDQRRDESDDNIEPKADSATGEVRYSSTTSLL